MATDEDQSQTDHTSAENYITASEITGRGGGDLTSYTEEIC